MKTQTLFEAFKTAAQQSHETCVRIAGGVGWLPAAEMFSLMRFGRRRERQLAAFNRAVRARLDTQAKVIPSLAAALKALTIAAWNSGNESLLDLACAGEEALRLVEPSFALCMWTAPDQAPDPSLAHSIADCESLCFATTLLELDCAPASRDAGEDNPPGS